MDLISENLLTIPDPASGLRRSRAFLRIRLFAGREDNLKWITFAITARQFFDLTFVNRRKGRVGERISV
jgi:hypothetical protein